MLGGANRHPQEQEVFMTSFAAALERIKGDVRRAVPADLITRATNALGIRNGSLPQRIINTGVGPVEVKQPRVRDRRPAGQREKFNSAILPPYLRKTKSIEELIPWLYLKGVSTGDFAEAL